MAARRMTLSGWVLLVLMAASLLSACRVEKDSPEVSAVGTPSLVSPDGTEFVDSSIDLVWMGTRELQSDEVYIVRVWVEGEAELGS